ncbi:F510_1955 family glycosylhydrolase [Paenibacillus sedimenti]|uniref:Glycosyl hydrolase n=1 Tax=Paenibacillus sedimenti TaxID=2770274 RepID=A0A926KWE1_9BACL|nr:glycosyl hydrolase [Paenibacillus sedimenti]MBD0383165.1 glycosyl hydrolase [Paenibacillus sedimenti]
MKKIQMLCLLVISVIAIVGCSSSSKITLSHVHGLGYTGDGKQILIPAHHGLVSYSNGKWGSFGGDKHDYMGFNTVDTGFYSSGHPAEGSDLKNPLGIVKSDDNGKKLQILDLHGVEDFHGMAVGYKTHAIYVYNPKKNEKMPSAGLFYSLDDARSWSKSNQDGISGEPVAIAAHPSDSSTVALITKAGLFISKDKGNHFNKVTVQFPTTGVSFTLAGDLLIGGPNSIVIQDAQQQVTTLQIPKLDQDDAVQYLSQNPLKESELVFSTFKKNVFISYDNGSTWSQIANQGKTQ